MTSNLRDVQNAAPVVERRVPVVHADAVVARERAGGGARPQSRLGHRMHERGGDDGLKRRLRVAPEDAFAVAPWRAFREIAARSSERAREQALAQRALQLLEQRRVVRRRVQRVAGSAGVKTHGFVGSVLGEARSLVAVSRAVLALEPPARAAHEQPEDLADVHETAELAGGALDDGGGQDVVLREDAEYVPEGLAGVHGHRFGERVRRAGAPLQVLRHGPRRQELARARYGAGHGGVLGRGRGGLDARHVM